MNRTQSPHDAEETRGLRRRATVLGDAPEDGVDRALVERAPGHQRDLVRVAKRHELRVLEPRVRLDLIHRWRDARAQQRPGV